MYAKSIYKICHATSIQAVILSIFQSPFLFCKGGYWTINLNTLGQMKPLNPLVAVISAEVAQQESCNNTLV